MSLLIFASSIVLSEKRAFWGTNYLFLSFCPRIWHFEGQTMSLRENYEWKISKASQPEIHLWKVSFFYAPLKGVRSKGAYKNRSPLLITLNRKPCKAHCFQRCFSGPPINWRIFFKRSCLCGLHRECHTKICLTSKNVLYYAS